MFLNCFLILKLYYYYYYYYYYCTEDLSTIFRHCIKNLNDYYFQLIKMILKHYFWGVSRNSRIIFKKINSSRINSISRNDSPINLSPSQFPVRCIFFCAGLVGHASYSIHTLFPRLLFSHLSIGIL